MVWVMVVGLGMSSQRERGDFRLVRDSVGGRGRGFRDRVSEQWEGGFRAVGGRKRGSRGCGGFLLFLKIFTWPSSFTAYHVSTLFVTSLLSFCSFSYGVNRMFHPNRGQNNISYTNNAFLCDLVCAGTVC